MSNRKASAIFKVCTRLCPARFATRLNRRLRMTPVISLLADRRRHAGTGPRNPRARRAGGRAIGGACFVAVAVALAVTCELEQVRLPFERAKRPRPARNRFGAGDVGREHAQLRLPRGGQSADDIRNASEKRTSRRGDRKRSSGSLPHACRFGHRPSPATGRAKQARGPACASGYDTVRGELPRRRKQRELHGRSQTMSMSY